MHHPLTDGGEVPSVQIKIYNPEHPIYLNPHSKHGLDTSQNAKDRERTTDAAPRTATNEKND